MSGTGVPVGSVVTSIEEASAAGAVHEPAAQRWAPAAAVDPPSIAGWDATEFLDVDTREFTDVVLG
jgi:hypothetical protein